MLKRKAIEINMTDQKCEECGEFKELNKGGICKGCEKWLDHFYLYKKYEDKNGK